MKRITFALFLVILSLFMSSRARAQAVAPVAAGETRAAAKADADLTGGIVTLYALDPVASSFCFGDGQVGRVVYGNEVRNRCSDIDFGNYNAGSFSVGIEGGRLGAIVDLGSADDLKRKYGFEETVNVGQGYASLRRGEGGVVLVKGRGRGATAAQALAESPLLFDAGKTSASAPVKLGDIYLIRLTDRRDKGFERVVKFKVVAYTPGESVTIRWQLL
ncbi:MAG TPA: hypothetical protein VFA21_08400 [Pyrinomonadaceae bacterium]|jgi:predicted RNA-binding protein with TRAM domain|nr:hypothetical protein [Pyrinomonadaceae bacterium]